MNDMVDKKSDSLLKTWSLLLIVVLIFSFLVLFNPFTCLARSQVVDDGAAWLAANQNASGSWGNPESTELRDSCVVANVLKFLGKTEAGYGEAVNFNAGSAHGNQDYIFSVGIKTVTDFCPGCSESQLDNFITDTSCSNIMDLGNFITIQLF